MKNFKKGKKVETKKEMAIIIANDLPYYDRGTLRLWGYEAYEDWKTCYVGNRYCHAEEVKEPKKLGVLLICTKSVATYTKGESIICGSSFYRRDYWKPVTVNENGEVFEAVTND